MTDERSVLYKWIDQQNFIEYPHKEIIKTATEKYMDKIASNEALHSLVRFSGTNIKSILSKSEKHLFKSSSYEDYLNKYARINKNREGISIFSLDSKYITHYNPFFFNNINLYIEGIKNYDEYYKAKVKKSDDDKFMENNPLKIGHSGMGFYLALLREAIMDTDVVKILVYLIENRKVHSFIDSEIEEFSAHVLTVLIDYAVEQEGDYADNLTVQKFQEFLETKKTLFGLLKDEAQFDQLIKSYKIFMKANTDDHEEEKKTEDGKKKKKIDKKKRGEMMRKRALDKLNKKRNTIAKNIGMNADSSSNWDTSSVASSNNDSEAPQCQK